MFETDQDDPAKRGHITFGRTTRSDPVDRYDFGKPVSTQVRTNTLDNDKNLMLWRRLMGHYRRELERQADNRAEMATDEDFYDSIQWTAEDRQYLLDRNQQPLVYNVIATTVNWLLGTEKRGRTDYRILPRHKEGSKSAERKSQILKYLSDVNRSEFGVSKAFADATKVGVGWLESGVQDDDEGEPVYDRAESWRNILFDSMAQEDDLSDGRYQFRAKWVDMDIARAMFPDRRAILNLASRTSLDFTRSLDGDGDEAMDTAEEAWSESHIPGALDDVVAERERVRLVEAWVRIPVEDRYMRGGQFTGEIFDPRSPGHQDEVMQGRAQVIRKVRMRMHVAIMCEAGLLFLAKSPYRHNQFPFTPIWCYRRGRDGLPYGIIRSMRDPQSDINKRASKALHILSTSKTIMDKGAVDDLDEFAEEVARPDAIIVKNPGKQLELNVDRELASAHLDLMSRSIQMIQSVGGITDENLGRTTNATSGKAIIARQDQGALATAGLFDNLRFARQIHGSKMLSLTEQFMSERKQFRITNMRGNPEFIDVNDGLPENDIVRTKADFIISEDDWNATMRQAQVEQLMEMMTGLGQVAPEVIMATLDLLVETMDVPQREELVKRIRQITGQEDPDADPENPDPETEARNAAKQEQADYAKRMAEAELADKEATAAEKRARADKIGAETGKVVAEIRKILANTAHENVETQVRALEAAAQIMGAQGLAGVADTVLEEAGFTQAPRKGAPMPGQAPQPPMPPQQIAQPPVPGQQLMNAGGA